MTHSDSSPRLVRTLVLGTTVLALAFLATFKPTAVRAQDTVATVAQDSAALAVRQVQIGEQWFRARCLECHDDASLSNADFRLAWGGRTAFDLFDQIRRTMPEEEPGVLTPGTYTAIVAYLMNLNGMPVGSVALATDSSAMSAVRLSFLSSSSRSR